MEVVRLVAQRREQAGKGVARRLRRAGQVPAVLYGNGETVAVTIAEKDLLRIQQSEAGENTIVDFVIAGDGAACNAILREVQIEPVKRTPLHADFYRVDMAKPITVTVPLEFINEPPVAFRQADVVWTPALHELEVECLPQDIPDVIRVDLELLQLGEPLKAGTLLLPPGVTLSTDAEAPVVTSAVVTEEVAESVDEGQEPETETETPAE
jgi:large subunit ribosomal protein L25